LGGQRNIPGVKYPRGKGSRRGRVEHMLKLRGLFLRREALGPRSSGLGRMEPDDSFARSGAPSQLNFDKEDLGSWRREWDPMQTLGFAFGQASQTCSPI
jgi:hypothetical protein